MPPFQTIASIAVALGHALLDGVWLGVLLAAALGLSFHIFKGVNAASRHAIWYAALVIIAVLPIASFGWSLAHAAPSAFVASATHPATVWTNSSAASTEKAYTIDEVRNSAPSHPTVHAAAAPISQATNASRLPISGVDIILAIVGVLAVVAAAGLIGVGVSLSRLMAVKRESRPFNPSDEARLRRWSTRPAGGRPVTLLLSQGVDVAAAVGFFHPAILVPASWPANLESDELDKIVMHEYSHLRRADDWTAFAQRVAERLFWFNPALRYVASRANLEREIACDDWVVAEASSATSYAECLWRLAQFAYMPTAKSLVPAALVTRAQIVERIEHLMNADRNGMPRMRPALLLAIAPIAAALLIVGVVRAPAITLAPIEPTAPVASGASAWSPSPSGVVRARSAQPAESAVPRPVIANAASHRTVSFSGNGLDVRSLLESCSGCDLSGKDLRNVDLHGLRLSGDDMSNVDLRGANLRDVQFEGVDLSGARLDNADLTGAVFSGAELRRVSWNGAKLDGLRLEGVKVDAAMLHMSQARRLLSSCQGCDMAGLDIRGIDLSGVHLEGADLAHADLRGVNLKNAVLDGVDLNSAQLDGADLTNASLNGCDLTHVDLRSAHIKGLRLEGADLRHLQFSGLDLRGLAADGADLQGVQLRNVDLSNVHMNGADFRSADLTGARLVDAEIEGADFRNAHLDDASLRQARLCGYDTYMDDHGTVYRKKKSCANLSGASTQHTDLRGVQICEWTGKIENCRDVSAADLKTLTHSDLTGAILPSF